MAIIEFNTSRIKYLKDVIEELEDENKALGKLNLRHEDDLEDVRYQAKRNQQKQIDREVDAYKAELEDLQSDFTELKIEHKEDIAELEIALAKEKNSDSDKVAKAKKAQHEAELVAAKAQAENTILSEMIEEEGNVVDVKTLITDLIGKLPQVDLQNFSVDVQAPAQQTCKKG